MVVTVAFEGKHFAIGEANNDISGQGILNGLQNFTGIRPEALFVSCNGRLVDASDNVADGSIVRAQLRVLGGKGGFGSMLRAIGAQIEKTTNREACRDLSGRRLRDINEEKRLKRWISKKADREREAEERKQERLERLKRQPKHDFHDPHYDRERSDLVERVSGAVEQGMKRKPAVQEGPAAAKKPKAIWLGGEELEMSDSSDEEDGACPVDRQPPGASRVSSSCEAEDGKPGTSSEGNSVEQSEGSNGEEPSTEKDSTTPATSSDSTRLQQQCEDSNEQQSQPSIAKNSSEAAANASIPEASSKAPRSEESEEHNKEELESQSSSEKNSSKEDGPLPSGQDSKQEIVNDKTDGQTKVQPTPAEEVKKDSEKSEPTESFNLNSVESIEELEALGMNQLKVHLSNMGLKCGGTLKERAERLWSVKGLKPDQIDPKLKAKPSKK